MKKTIYSVQGSPSGRTFRVRNMLSIMLAVIMSFLALTVPVSADVVTEELVPVLRKGTSEFREEIDISDIVRKHGWSRKETLRMLSDAFFCMPELFFIKNEVTLHTYTDGTNYAIYEYIMSPTKMLEAKKRLDAAASRIAAGVTADMTDVEKALYVHDYIITNCSSDLTETRYDAYDCLVDRSAVCQGYSLAYMYVMKYFLGIDCTVVYSDTINHAWNYVKIDGNWYHVDLMTDDKLTSYKNTSYDNLGYVCHTNFLISDKRCYEVSGLHRDWIVAGGFPAATDTRYDNAFWKDCTSAICLYGRKGYFAKKNSYNDGKGGLYFNICEYDFRTNTARNIMAAKSVWFARRSSGGELYDYGTIMYNSIWVSCALYNGKIFFNTSKSVYCYDIATRTSKKVYTLDKGDDQIFGLVYISGRIRIAYRPDKTYPEKYISLVIS